MVLAVGCALPRITQNTEAHTVTYWSASASARLILVKDYSSIDTSNSGSKSSYRLITTKFEIHSAPLCVNDNRLG